MEHLHGTLNYRGDVGDDLMGKLFQARPNKFVVVTGTTYNPETNMTKAELDELTVDNQPPVVMMEGTP